MASRTTTHARIAAAFLAAAVAFLGDGRAPAAARADGDPPAPRKDAAATTIALVKPVRRLAASPDGARLALVFTDNTAAVVPTDGTAPRELDLVEESSVPGATPKSAAPRPLAVTFTRGGRRVVVLTQRLHPDPAAALTDDRAFIFEALVFDATTGERKHRVRLGDPAPIDKIAPVRLPPGPRTDWHAVLPLEGGRVLIDREDGVREIVDAGAGARHRAAESFRQARTVGVAAAGRTVVLAAADPEAAPSLPGVTLTLRGEEPVGTRFEVRRTADAHRASQFPWSTSGHPLDDTSRPALSEDEASVFLVVKDGNARRIEARAASDGLLRWRTGDVGAAPVELLPPRDGLLVVRADDRLRAFATSTGSELTIPDVSGLTVSAAAPTAQPRVVWVLVGDRAAARVSLPAASK